MGSGGGAGRGLPKGRGLADTAAGVPARAVGDAEHRRDNLAAGEGGPGEDTRRTAPFASSVD